MIDLRVIDRVSLASDGTQANSVSLGQSISADGRFVAFTSVATNLVPNDTNALGDVFVFDRDTDTIERVSVSSAGAQGDAVSGGFLSISGDGRFVAFVGASTNLVPNDTNGQSDVFVFDRQADTIERVNVDANGNQADGGSNSAKLSADGRFIAFNSGATNLVPNDTNGMPDIFVVDRQTDAIQRVSVANGGVQADGFSFSPAISADGRFVAFQSDSTNLVPDDTNGQIDVFVFDRVTNTIERVSIANDGTQSNGLSGAPTLSADGRFVAFGSSATNLVANDSNAVGDIFVYDRQTDTIERVSVADDGTQANGISSSPPTLSADGRFVTFGSNASNLVPNDTNASSDVFVFDRQTDTIGRVLSSTGAQGNSSVFFSSVTASADGRFVAIDPAATNMIPGDTNGAVDILVAGIPTLTIANAAIAEGNAGSTNLDFTISLSPPAPNAVTVTVTTANGTAAAGSDYAATTQTVTIPGGQGSATFTVPLTGDTVVEPNETFSVALSNPINAVIAASAAVATGTIANDDATLSIANAQIVEGNSGPSNLVFTITRAGDTTNAASVTATTSNGTANSGSDYTATTGTVTIPAGQSSTTFSVPILGDTLDEADETFTVTLSNPSGATIGTASATGTITDNDSPPSVSIANASVAEGGGSLVFTVSLSAPAGQNVTVTASTADGSALAGSDYTATSGAVTIPAGQSSATFSVPILGDALNESDETFTVTLNNPTGATLGASSTATGTILDDDSLVLSIADASIAEGGGTLVFTISLSAPAAQDVSVQASTLNGAAIASSDYTATSSLVTIPAGQTSATFSVPVSVDNGFEIDEAFLARLSAPTGGASISTTAGYARGTIVNDDQPVLPTITGQTINGTGGDDFLVGSALNDSITGEGGADTEFGNEQSDILIGGSGNDFIVADFPANFLFGERDFIDAGDGNDNVFAGGGDDTAFGGNGDDLIGGDVGNNLIFGGDGNNALFGFGDADTIQGGNDGDIVFGLSGPDVIVTLGGLDLIIAGGDFDGPTDADFIDMADGGGSVFAGSGDDTILAGAGDDFMLGESGADLMISGGGADALIAGPGNDTLEAGAGNDVIIPEGGDDSISGGPGIDLFRYPGGIAVNADRIGDFTPADDTIELAASLGFATAAQALAAVTQNGADAVLTVTGGSITFVGLQATSLTTVDFVIV